MTVNITGGAPAPSDEALLSLDDTPPEPPAEPTPEEQQPPAEEPQEQADPEPDAQPEGEQPRPKKSAQERISELTWKAREAERQRDELLDRMSRTEQAPQQPQGDGRPDAAAYEYGAADERYVEDLAAWKADSIVSQRLGQFQAHTNLQAQVSAFEQRLAQQFPDGEPEGVTAIRRLPTVPGAIQDVLLSAPNGPRLAQHLGDNPHEFQRLSALPPHMQAYELAKIEAAFAAPPRQSVKIASDAPPVAPQVRAANGKFQADLNTCSFAEFEKYADKQKAS